VHYNGDAVAFERLHAFRPFVADKDLHLVTVRDADVLPDDFDVLGVSGGRRHHEHHRNNEP
jgi:hypothetical protein